jgi:DNA-binding XRE family transcriptional regulator
LDNTVLMEFIELSLAVGVKRQTERLSSRRVVSAMGTAVHRRRLQLGMSIEELANSSGLKSKTLVDLESGRACDLKMNELWKLSMALDTFPSKLLKEAE